MQSIGCFGSYANQDARCVSSPRRRDERLLHATAHSETANPQTAAPTASAAPYRYGGGHGSFDDSAYDCLGSVSFALRGGNLIEAPLASPGLVSWDACGSGRWITIYAKASHMHMVVAGLRFDRSARAEGGLRWMRARRSTDGYAVRHPAGL